MKWKQLHETGGLRTFALVFATDDEPIELLLRFAAEHRVTGAALTGIGAFRRVVLGYFEWERKEYRDIPVDEQVEVASLVGNLGRTEDGGAKAHVHLVVTTRDGAALGGHLRSAVVRPTLEMVVTETPVHLARSHDDETGLALIDFD